MPDTSSAKITVYVVNHNYGRYLNQAINSVLEQSLQDFELIIIDDGSTDDSRQIIETYESHEKILVIYQHNQGLNVTNNIALRAASGRYIMRLDADDYLDPHALKVMSDILDQDDGLCLVSPDYYRVDEEGHPIEIVRRHDFEEVSLKDMPAHGACTMIRREYLEELGGYDEEFRCQDGYELWVRLIRNYKVRNVNLPLFYYRQHQANLTRNEDRILETRSRILAKANSRDRLDHQAVAVIPVRGAAMKTGFMALRPLEGHPLIGWTIDAALGAERISDVIVTTPDDTVISYVNEAYGDKVICIKREKELARLNTHVEDTLEHAITEYGKSHEEPATVALLMIESPFRTSSYIDSAIDSMQFFDTDIVLAVRQDEDAFFRHDGNGLVPVRKGLRLRLESEDMFREVGQLRIVNMDFLKRTHNLNEGRLGHVVLDQKAAFVVESEWDWEIAELEASRRIQNSPGGPS
jgi:CMP-N-acetylneuraminic acid synthetase